VIIVKATPREVIRAGTGEVARRRAWQYPADREPVLDGLCICGNWTFYGHGGVEDPTGQIVRDPMTCEDILAIRARVERVSLLVRLIRLVWRTAR
jgi:hypothetical protein